MTSIAVTRYEYSSSGFEGVMLAAAECFPSCLTFARLCECIGFGYLSSVFSDDHCAMILLFLST